MNAYKGKVEEYRPERAEGLILGAGPAGMAAALELHNAGKSFLLLEKEERVGGLAKTLKFGEFRTDIGPHRFLSQNRYLYRMIENLLGGQWIKVDRFTRFYINNRFFIYPVELKNAISNVGLYKTFTVILDYMSERFKRNFVKNAPLTFEEKVISDFGKSLAELNILNYTEKIWGLPCSEISPDWAMQRIKKLSIGSVIKKAVLKSKRAPKTLADQFYYPDIGSGLIYEKIRDIIINDGALRLNSFPISIAHDNNKIREVVFSASGASEAVKPQYLISSIPITEFVSLLEPEAPADVSEACKRLKFRSHVSLFITIDRPSVFPGQWIYFPEKEIPFSRITEPKNFSRKMAPHGKSSLLLEFFCWENDRLWNAGAEELFELSIEWLERHGFIKRGEVMERFIHKEKYAYPVYDLDYKIYVKTIKDYLREFKNLQLVGRAGSFRYNNQDHSLEMGILAARNVIEGNKYNIEEIGASPRYFEEGRVR